ncbi:conserved hypothetical protein [Ricinus communis]|uniref:Uncharacterized protein n=1 Tax=Ricinus communis TaxID=3988 RepID=B9SZS4_RICCO|nr:conserved hypothetical protein [Ricinus communis]
MYSSILTKPLNSSTGLPAQKKPSCPNSRWSQVSANGGLGFWGLIVFFPRAGSIQGLLLTGLGAGNDFETSCLSTLMLKILQLWLLRYLGTIKKKELHEILMCCICYVMFILF